MATAAASSASRGAEARRGPAQDRLTGGVTVGGEAPLNWDATKPLGLVEASEDRDAEGDRTGDGRRGHRLGLRDVYFSVNSGKWE